MKILFAYLSLVFWVAGLAMPRRRRRGDPEIFRQTVRRRYGTGPRR